MMNFKVLFIFFLLSFNSFSQNLSLNKQLKIDTLKVSLDFSNKIEKELRISIYSALQKTVTQFNTESPSYKVVIDSLEKGHFIKMEMEKIDYVNTRKNIGTSMLDVGIIVGHIIMLSTHSWTIPVYPFLMPTTTSEIDLRMPRSISPRRQGSLIVKSNGYFTGIEKQNVRFIERFENRAHRMFMKIDKINSKNQKEFWYLKKTSKSK